MGCASAKQAEYGGDVREPDLENDAVSTVVMVPMVMTEPMVMVVEAVPVVVEAVVLPVVAAVAWQVKGANQSEHRAMGLTFTSEAEATAYFEAKSWPGGEAHAARLCVWCCVLHSRRCYDSLFVS
jgi:hypothetical protein